MLSLSSFSLSPLHPHFSVSFFSLYNLYSLRMILCRPQRPELCGSSTEWPSFLSGFGSNVVFVFDRHGYNQSTQGPLGSLNLTIPNRPLTQGQNCDLSENLAMPYSFAGKLRDEMVKWGLGDLRWVSTHCLLINWGWLNLPKPKNYIKDCRSWSCQKLSQVWRFS